MGLVRYPWAIRYATCQSQHFSLDHDRIIIIFVFLQLEEIIFHAMSLLIKIYVYRVTHQYTDELSIQLARQLTLIRNESNFCSFFHGYN